MKKNIQRNNTTVDIKGSNMVKDPNNWKAGEEPVTRDQYWKRF